MRIPFPPLLCEEPAGSGDGEEPVVLLEPPADFPQFVLCVYCMQDHCAPGGLWGGGDFGGGRRLVPLLSFPFLFPIRFGGLLLLLILGPVEVLVRGGVGRTGSGIGIGSRGGR